MLGCQHQIRRTEQGVGPGGEDLDIPRVGGEAHLGAGRPADPVALHGLDLVRPIEDVEIVEQSVGIGGDPHHPLPQALSEYRKVAAVTAAVGGHLFVGQHRTQPRAPVHHRVGSVHQAEGVDEVRAFALRHGRPLTGTVRRPGAGLEFGDQLADRTRPVGCGIEPGVEDLQEDPLRPLVEVGVRRGEAAPRVVAEPQPAELAAEVDDVGLGAGPRMCAGLHRILFGGQAERIEPQRVQHVTASHPEIAGVDVGCDVAKGMTDVQTLAGRIGEHVLDEHLVRRNRSPVGGCERSDGVGHVERPEPRPGLLPGAFDPSGERRVVAVLRSARGVRAAFPISHADQGSQRAASTLHCRSWRRARATGWCRFRCRGVLARLQVDSGPSGDRRGVDTVGAWPVRLGPSPVASSGRTDVRCSKMPVVGDFWSEASPPERRAFSASSAPPRPPSRPFPCPPCRPRPR